VLRWLSVFAIALAIYLPGSSAPFSNTAESQEALVAWEMVRGGDWILPRVNGELIPSKPPFYHWIVAAFSSMTGDVDELTARLPSIVAAAACVVLVYGTGAHRWQPLAGIIAAVVLATSPEWAKWATTARTDATFSFLLTASLLLGERWLRKGDLGTLLALGAVTGAATLAKGFAAAGLVALVLAFGIWRRGQWQRLHPVPLLSAAAVFGAVAGSWYSAALAREGFAFFHKQIVLENVLRFLPNEEGGPSRHHSWLFYVPMIFTGMLPWSLALPSALRRAYRERFTVEGFPAYLLTWIGVVFLVCTLASGKRTNYVLPLYPAAALLVGRQLAVLLECTKDGRQFALRAAGWLSAGLLAVLGALLLAWQTGMEPWRPVLPWLHPQDRVLLPKMVAVMGYPGTSAILLCAGLSAALALATLRNRWKELYAIVGLTILLATVAAEATLQHLESKLKSFAPFSQRVAAVVGTGPLVFYESPDLAVLYYLRRHVPVERRPYSAIVRPGWALVWSKAWKSLPTSQRDGDLIVEQSPPASIGRADTTLLLVRLAGAR
jgi:4-amino-4-deoxy-L-arabinose transferase-like glycosyltransferase